MTKNSKKKKKTEELIAVWTTLKPKLMITINQLKEIKTHGFKEVYRSNSAIQKIRMAEENNDSKIARLEKQLLVDSQRYQSQLTTRLNEYTRLEKKLEQIRNLLADQQLNKLIALYKRGEI